MSLRPTSTSSPLELRATLGRGYPGSKELRLHAKSDSFSRESQSGLNEAMKGRLEELEEGELLLGVMMQWLQEKWELYKVREKEGGGGRDKRADKPAPKWDSKFSRLWIYSHHIYSKTKRKNILDLASEFQLTGFSMPGKPGIICLEGCSRNCTEAWGVIKSWNWKKINVKVQEDREVEGDVDGLRRFEDFQEIGFVKNSESRDYHMDMGEFFNFLKKHESEYMFKYLFGIYKGS